MTMTNDGKILTDLFQSHVLSEAMERITARPEDDFWSVTIITREILRQNLEKNGRLDSRFRQSITV